MTIKHSVVKQSNETGYAWEWNEEHIIDSDIDFYGFSGINIREPINPSDITTKNYVDGIEVNLTNYINNKETSILNHINTVEVNLTNYINNKETSILNHINTVESTILTYVDNTKATIITYVDNAIAGIEGDNLGNHIAIQDLNMNSFNIYNVAEPVSPSDVATKNYVDVQATPIIQAPIGSISAWLKNLPSVPSLPSGWVECNGQVLDDGDSPLDGKTIPNLNGRFLRGASTSGGTGGATSVTKSLDRGGGMSARYGCGVWGDTSSGGMDAIYASVPGIGTHLRDVPILRAKISAIPTVPPYYNVVLIMRVK